MDTPQRAVRVSVDADRCRASAVCVREAGGIFALPVGGTAAALHDTLSDPEQILLAERAESACPTMAVILEEVELN